MIPQSVLKGAIYIEGAGVMACEDTNCGEEVFTLKNNTFTKNYGGYLYRVDGGSHHRASALFIRNHRNILLELNRF